MQRRQEGGFSVKLQRSRSRLARTCSVAKDPVSRRRARSVIDEKGAVVEDLGSKNGTFVNDQRVTAPTPVVEGD
jgi:pSer/pThr/pTyr-binding forkhead associated (FHA) protein